ncbi:hypothetical protein AFCDBAGC_4895 [Methylobacterium cerastii]|uniref:Uncharacterized protein n=1 Tax=Methylobacterium cerastii TaxID=932741 RepID=A0ABQ4QP02_9HYPH|nr:hypothetical protein [Methylobacterium cerastii]GJD47010.1 hypothetical protein AFCDBAGC_4895 [Methylobacterium cerastii]
MNTKNMLAYDSAEHSPIMRGRAMAGRSGCPLVIRGTGQPLASDRSRLEAEFPDMGRLGGDQVTAPARMRTPLAVDRAATAAQFPHMDRMSEPSMSFVCGKPSRVIGY